MLPTLHIHLLGEFRLLSGETSVTSIDTSRLQSLLAYLVLHRTAPQSRSHLAFLLWPDSTETQAHSNLRTLVTRLRQALPNAESFLHADRHSLQWQPDASWTLDVLDFERALAQADQQEHAKDPTIVRPALVKALTLYRGDLLPSCYDEWILPERDRLARCFREALERLLVVLEQERDYAAAIRVAQRLLRYDPLNEAAYRDLMRLYAMSGDPVAALRTYHTCATILERDLASGPSPATQEVYQHLVQKGTSTAPLAVSSTVSVAVAPLVGRLQEWTQLQQAWRRTVAGQPHMVIISGEAGIGKTRLAEELLAWVARQGMTVASARCYAAEGEMAYSALTSWFRADDLRRSLSALADVWLTEVARFVPEIVVERSDLPHPVPLTESWQRQRLFDALVRAILAARQPLLLFLDDLQWCDQETLEWLHYLLRFDPHARILLAGTVRLEEMTTDHPLESLLVALQRGEQITEIVLGPLNEVDTATLAVHVAGRELAQDRLADLYQETEGNPLFVVETLRVGVGKAGGMERQFIDDPITPHDVHLSPTMRTVLAARLRQLSSQARELVNVAATIGRAFTFEVLAQASGSEEDLLVGGLDELWQRRIMREQGTDTYDFSHDKLREVAYAALSSAHRRLLHRRVLAALQATGAPSAQLAHHALHAGLVDLACRFSRAAGDESMRLFAVRDAVTHYEQALQMVRKRANGQHQYTHIHVTEMQQLYLQLGRAYELSSDYQKADTIYQTMLTLAREEHEPTMECAALNRLAMLAMWNSSEKAKATTLLQEALNVAERAGDSVALAETEWSLARTSQYALDAQEALLHAQRALTLARKHDLKDLIARSLNALSYAQDLMSNWGEVVTCAEEASALYATLGNRAMEADCLAQVGKALIFSGRSQEGIRVVRIAHEISVEIENAWGQAYSSFLLSLGLQETGAYTEALTVIQQGLTPARTQSYRRILIDCLLSLGLVEGMLFLQGTANATLQEAATVNETFGLQITTEAIAATRCMTHALANEWDEATRYALEAHTARNYRFSFSYVVQFTFCYETEALLRGGEIERAEEGVRRFGACVGENRRSRIAYLRALAVLTSWKGETHQAVAYLQEALRLSEELGLPGEQWHIEAALGELYQALGDECQSHEAFARAAKVVQALANALEDEQLQKSFLSGRRVQRVLT